MQQRKASTDQITAVLQLGSKILTVKYLWVIFKPLTSGFVSVDLVKRKKKKIQPSPFSHSNTLLTLTWADAVKVELVWLPPPAGWGRATGSLPPFPWSGPPRCHWGCRWASAGAAGVTGCDVMLRSQAASDPAGGPCAGAAGRVGAAADGGGPSCQENRAAAGTDWLLGCCRCWSAAGPAVLITRRGTGRFRCRCQKTDPGGVWSRLEPRGKALQRKREREDTKFGESLAANSFSIFAPFWSCLTLI